MVIEKPKPVAAFGCRKWPQLRIRELQFKNSVLTVFSEEDADLVRSNDTYGQYIEELEVGFEYDLAPEFESEGEARQGLRSAGDPRELRPEAPDPVNDSPESIFPEVQWPQDNAQADPEEVLGEPSVLAKPGGWYEYNGKNYRKADLPAEVRDLV